MFDHIHDAIRRQEEMAREQVWVCCCLVAAGGALIACLILVL